MASLSHTLASHITDPDNREIYTEFISRLLNQCHIHNSNVFIRKLDDKMEYPEVETMAFHLSRRLTLTVFLISIHQAFAKRLRTPFSRWSRSWAANGFPTREGS